MTIAGPRILGFEGVEEFEGFEGVEEVEGSKRPESFLSNSPASSNFVNAYFAAGTVGAGTSKLAGGAPCADTTSRAR